ncbi:MAG: Benzoate--CoA ligase [Syntrophorhabdaceae bacterium PtaU1.Bin034]|nr:MAG: Benzoate--CoA ligase [Syntrophorhabdaceae bacterium PtaU1.Bin034]
MKKSNSPFNLVSELLGRHAAERGEKTAIYFEDTTVDYRTLMANINRFANVLAELKIKPKERVLLLLPDSPLFVYAFLGSIKYGACPVPVNTMLREEDYKYLLEDSEAAVLVTTKDSPAARVRTSRLHYKLFADNGLMSMLSTVSDAADAYAAREDDVAFWLYSSGSTGRPKGVPHRHIDMIHAADSYGKGVLNVTEDDIVYSVSKLFFAYGLGNGIGIPFRTGASVVLSPEKPTPEGVVSTVSRYRPTVFFGVPTQYNSVLKKLRDDSAFASVRTCVSAGEALPPEVFNRWKERTGLEILDGIGSTEALHIFISNFPNDTRPGTSGRVVPGYEAKIVDEEGNEVPSGEAGHLIIRGESVTKGYWNRPEENQEKILEGGWFRTGDMYSQQDGYFRYQGRGDDMLKVGGIWVSPIEIENVLIQHRAVQEVAVVGHNVEGLSKPFAYVSVNDEYSTQGPKGSDGLSEELLSFVSERLPRFKWLHGVYIVEELPKTATGKIQRFKLRK